MTEISVNNEASQVRLRKYRSILGTSGKGVILLALWSVARTVIQIIFSPISSDEYGFSQFVITIVYVFLFIIMAVDMILRIIVGVNAGKESRGIKKGWGYIVLTFILLAISIVSMVSIIIKFDAGMITVGFLATAITELVSMVVLVEVIVSGIIVKRAGK